MDLEKAERASEAWTRLLKAASECQRLHVEAGMELPAPLRQMLGMTSTVVSIPPPATPPVKRPAKSSAKTARTSGSPRLLSTMMRPRIPQQAVLIAPPQAPRPPDVPENWISVPLASATTTTYVRAFLRAATVPITAKQIADQVKSRTGDASEGSIANVLSREDDIKNVGEGWILTDPASGTVLNGKYAWGPIDVFASQELAARRREAVLYVLSQSPKGLKRGELMRQLQGCSWLKVKLSEDVVRADLEQLANKEAKVIQRGSKRWVAVTGGTA
jgi:hypothetical protein